MQIRSVIKLGVVLSVVLFCIGIAFYVNFQNWRID